MNELEAKAAVNRALVTMLALLTLGATAAEPEAPDARARVDPTSVQVGQSFELEVAVTHNAADRYDFNPPAEAGEFDVLGQERARSDSGARATTTFKIKLSAYKLGALKTPAFVFDVASPTGTSQFTAPQVDISVVRAPGDTSTDLKDPHPPVDVAIRTWRVVYAALALAALVLLAAWLRRFLKRPKALVVAPPVPLAPLDVRTLQALDVLRNENLPAAGRVREFHFRLSEIIRAYLGERYSFDAMECTSSELLDTLRRLRTPGLSIAPLREFTVQNDLARYAKAAPGADECKSSLEFAYRLVHETTASQPPATPEVARAS